MPESCQCSRHRKTQDIGFSLPLGLCMPSVDPLEYKKVSHCIQADIWVELILKDAEDGHCCNSVVQETFISLAARHSHFPKVIINGTILLYYCSVST
eukprot:jgi/Chrzof1/6005/Cz17g00120.t1